MFAFSSFAVFAQDLPATIRVEVTAEGAPVEGAAVSVGTKTVVTDRSGTVSVAAPLGSIEITAEKDGFLPARTQIVVTDVREWRVTMELQAAKSVKEEITVSATRTEARLQDVPTR